MSRNPINYPVSLSYFNYESRIEACAHIYLCLLNPFNERVYLIRVHYKNSFYSLTSYSLLVK